MTEHVVGQGSFGRYNDNMESPFYPFGIDIVLVGQMFGNWKLLHVQELLDEDKKRKKNDAIPALRPLNLDDFIQSKKN
ncbi:hypothetical protein LXL04_013451 [Taraxacum kok-saghyz]